MRKSRSDWPLTLTAELAAEYVGCRSAAQFRREVKAGRWPKPCFGNSRPQRWSREQLDGELTGGRGDAHNPHLAELERNLSIANDERSPLSRFGRQQKRRA